ncbi:CtsR family transcriptional regulator [Proteinivorax hydrogeniformans]|uniref:CtsR family transcriptional regulator n=1 Tax=Proteinivorax hydrogeniformans TaxID=1826727 RepID=A0AAU8HTT9_9FIRM
MASVAGRVEKYILDLLNKNHVAVFKRNEMAILLNCAPSQINYVLQTRFSTEKGYKVESQRGGGGFIRITKISSKGQTVLEEISYMLEKGVTQKQSQNIISRLVEQGIFTQREGNILVEATAASTLDLPLPARDIIRGKILKSAIVYVCKLS